MSYIIGGGGDECKQMIMAGNPNWWIMNGGGMHQQQQQQQLSNSTNYYLSPSSSSSSHSQYLYGSSTPLLLPSSTASDGHPNQHFPRSWSQLLMCGLPISDQERFGSSECQYNWFQNNGEDQQHIISSSISSTTAAAAAEAVKQESGQLMYGHGHYGHHVNEEEYHHHHHEASRISSRPPPHQLNQLVSSPTSCVTSTNLLNFSTKTTKTQPTRNQQYSDHSSDQGNSSISSGGVAKKPRLQQSSTQPALKVRKEKLGERITALHQIVSPFGKTDTASVLSEAIGYIRFLLGQIEALSSPYLGNIVSKSMGHQHSVQDRNCLLIEEPDEDGQTHEMDLSSRGLCLVPISCTQHVGNENGADYWAPAFGGGF